MWSKKELIDKQAAFWGLMARGSTLTAACNAVGVNRRTGRHWRQATGGRIPRSRPEPSGRYLSLDERLQIADLRLAGVGVRAIATQLGRSPSTISRELSRNGPEPGGRSGGKYVPYAAQKRSELRGRRPKASKFDDAELASVVQTKLCVKWSPEQISLHLAARFPGRAEMQVCHETIYQALFVQGRGHLRADLHQHATGSTPGHRAGQAPRDHLATNMNIYFCDPHSPWQRGSNENANGLLRQYFPKGTDLSMHTPERLLEVATELNARPRKTPAGNTPAQAMQRLLFEPEIAPA